MSSYYRCSFFEKDNFSKKNYEHFVVDQEQLIFKKLIDTKSKKAAFSKKNILYNCHFIKSSTFNKNKPCLIIPIKNNLNLLKFTVANLEQNNINKNTNIFIVDDRSTEDLKNFCLGKNLSYLRVDNDSGFNFSMLNNIAAKICFNLDSKLMILWNSDLWCVKEEYFLDLLERHKKEKSKVSGSKLVYPPKEKSLEKEEDTKNIKKHFPNLIGGAWRNTVQFGGDYWVSSPESFVNYTPIHHKRFTNINNNIVNCDRGAFCVTGALQVWDLEFFIKIGGFNPSLPKVYQDNDICLRVIELGEQVNYFGKNIYFYHDESLVHFSLEDQEKEDHQNISDHILFGKIWNEKLGNILF